MAAAFCSSAAFFEAAPYCLRCRPVATNASELFHGFAGLFPVTAAMRDAKVFHVEGMNCAGPMAPPYVPSWFGQEIFANADVGSIPSERVISSKTGISFGFMFV